MVEMAESALPGKVAALPRVLWPMFPLHSIRSGVTWPEHMLLQLKGFGVLQVAEEGWIRSSLWLFVVGHTQSQAGGESRLGLLGLVLGGALGEGESLSNVCGSSSRGGA